MSQLLVTHTKDGTVEIPLTGDPAHDALLERLARRGGPTFRHEGDEDPAERDARLALQGGA